MKTCHVIEVSASPYYCALPRRYYASDYPEGSVVVDQGISWTVVCVDDALIFQAL